MPSDRAGRLTPEAIARTTFQTSFRGYDAEHVRAFLDEIAAELRDARDREAALRQQIASLEARQQQAAQLDEAQLTVALGEETARVLTTAREAAVDIRTKAEEAAARVMKDAHDEAGELRSRAAAMLAERTREADERAAEIRAEAEAAAAGVLAEAETRAATLRAQAEDIVSRARADAEKLSAEATEAAAAEVEAARATGRQMVQEAQAVRERVLRDLARKRKAARGQLEQLRAGRERLLEAYGLVRRTLDEATDELKGSLQVAKQAADAALRRVEAEPEDDVEALEAEVEAARLAGLPLVTDLPGDEELPAPPTPAAPTASEPVVEAPVDDGLPPLPEEIPPAPEAPAPVLPPRAKKRRGAPELPPVELTPLAPPDPVEAMRVITGEQPAVVIDAPAAEELAPPEAVPAGAGAADVEPVATNDEPEVDVDDLFARIRAARAEEVAKAEVVLAEVEVVSEVDVEVEVDEQRNGLEADEVALVEVVVGSEEPEPTVEAVVDDAARLERRDGLLEPIEQRVARKLKRVLADEQNDVLDRLRRTHAHDLDALFPELEAQAERFAAAVRDELAAASAAGASFGGVERTGPPVDEVAIDLALELVTPLRDRLVSALEAVRGDEEAAADAVRACYREWKSQRLGPLAADAALSAFSRGQFEALDPGQPLRWIVDDGGSPCPDAEDNALAGVVARGDSFPTGHCFPPAHPGCRCLLVPVDVGSG